MAAVTLGPDEHLTVSFHAEVDDEDVRFVVEAERPVYAHIVDGRNLTHFREGEAFTYFGPRQQRREHDFTEELPRAGKWYLLIINEHDESIAVHYELYE
jgi:hypothetical protein